jgi:hypothetical protein
MAKATSFAEKAAKAAREKGKKCPKCETVLTPILYVDTVLNKKNNSHKFLQKRMVYCKCNEKEIFG